MNYYLIITFWVFTVINQKVSLARDPEVQRQIDEYFQKLLFDGNQIPNLPNGKPKTKLEDVPEFLREIVESRNKDGFIEHKDFTNGINQINLFHGKISVTTKGTEFEKQFHGINVLIILYF